MRVILTFVNDNLVLFIIVLYIVNNKLDQNKTLFFFTTIIFQLQLFTYNDYRFKYIKTELILSLIND